MTYQSGKDNKNSFKITFTSQEINPIEKGEVEDTVTLTNKTDSARCAAVQ